jgi:hypothetical protein
MQYVVIEAYEICSIASNTFEKFQSPEGLVTVFYCLTILTVVS